MSQNPVSRLNPCASDKPTVYSLGFATKGWEPREHQNAPRWAGLRVSPRTYIPVSVDCLNELTLEALTEFASQETDMYLHRIGEWVGVDVPHML